MESQIQMVCPGNSAAFLRLRGFCICGSRAFSRQYGSPVRIGASKYTSRNANRASVRRNSLARFRAKETSASLFVSVVRADYRCVLGGMARPHVAAAVKIFNNYAAGHNLCKSGLLVHYLRLFVRTK